MKLTRKQLLAGGAAGAALGAAGIYELVDQLSESPPARFGEGRGPEQHLLDGMQVKDLDGVEVVVPPRHHQLVTAKVAAARGDLRDAQTSLEEVLRRLDDRYPGTPDGLGITLAWGLPYFRAHVEAAAERHLPVDRRASSSSKTKRALLDVIRFPTDPDDRLFEQDD